METIEELTSKNDENIRILQSCFKTNKESYIEIISEITKIIRGLATEINIEIESLNKISTTNLFSGFSFYHPAIIGQLKSTGSKSKDEILKLINEKFAEVVATKDDENKTGFKVFVSNDPKAFDVDNLNEGHYLPGIISRKKQIIPNILKVIEN